jgi:hypothetical protein
VPPVAHAGTRGAGGVCCHHEKKPKIIKLVFIIDLNLTLLIIPLASYGTELILTTAGTK